MSRSSHIIPFAVATCGIAVFSTMDAVMKGLSLAIGAYDAILWRSVAGTAITGTIFLVTRTRWPVWAVLRVHLLRGGISAAMTILFFWGLARVPMAQAVSLTFVAPLVAMLPAGVVLKEPIGRGAVIGSGIAVAGVAVLFFGQARADPGREAAWGSLSVLGSALCYAWNIVLMRQQAQVARPVEIAFFQTGTVAAIMLAVAPMFAMPPAPAHWPALIGAAMLATTSLMLLSWAYARGRASELAPSEYTGFVWAALLGWLVFGEALSAFTLAGAALIVCGCLAGLRTRPPGRQPARPPAGEQPMTVTIRFARPDDVPTIMAFVRELATFERAADAVVSTEALLHEALFGANPAAEALVAEAAGAVIGMAVFHYTFSTWTGRRGIWLDDLYVTPDARGCGAGSALLRRLARVAVERDCARFEWSVLDWNAPAVDLYRRIGAEAMDEWTVQRLSGDALAALAG